MIRGSKKSNPCQFPSAPFPENPMLTNHLAIAPGDKTNPRDTVEVWGFWAAQGKK